jgi:hypothetical protein
MSRKRKASPRFAALKAKPPLFWLKLAGIMSVAGYIAWLSFIHAVANITWQQNPDMALRFVPDHPLALSRKADELFAAKQDPATLAKVEAMAKQSLRGGALNPVAIRLLGYVADVRGDRKKARELMLLSQKVSRRDFGTQLWLIEDAVARNDKKQALYHYDIAMRTTPSSFPVLFPTLAGALSDPEVRAGLVPFVNKGPEWLLSFLSYANGNLENPVYLADVLIKSGRLPDRPEYTAQSNYLLNALALRGQFRTFELYYNHLPNASAKSLSIASLTKETVNIVYPAAGWQLTESPSIGGAFSEPDKSGKFTLSTFAGSGERGELMRKYLFLNPGSYGFSAQYEAQQTAPDSEIRWDLTCVSQKAPTSKWFINKAVMSGKTGDFKTFTLTTDCPHQLLTLQLAGGSGQLGAEFILRSVDIIRTP